MLWRVAGKLVRSVALLFAATIVLQVHPSAAQTAEDKPSKAARAERAKKKVRRIIEMEALEVRGKVQRPRVYLLFEREGLKYRGLPMERDVLKEIQESVRDKAL